MATIPKSNSIIRTKVFKGKFEDVWSIVADLKEYSRWNPWQILENVDAPEGYTEGVPTKSNMEYSTETNTVGGYQKWNSRVLGKGELHIKSIEKDNNQGTIISELLFYMNRKSNKKTSSESIITIEKLEGGYVRATWQLNWSLPLFIRFMHKPMSELLSIDYDRGLDNISHIAGDTSNPYSLSFLGIRQTPRTQYIGMKFKGSNEALEHSKATIINSLNKEVEAQNLKVQGHSSFIIFKKINIWKRSVSTIICVPVETLPSTLPKKFVKGVYNPSNSLVVKLTGSHEHRYKAWSYATALAKGNEAYKPAKAILCEPPCEVVLKGMDDTNHAKEYETLIVINMKKRG